MRSFWTRLRHLCVLPIFVFALITGLRGIDYGGHPDEHVIFAGVKQMLNSGVFLPRWYGYPSFSFYVALLPSLKYTTTLRLAPELCAGSRADSNDALQEASLFEGYVNKHPNLLAVVDADTSGRTKSDIGKTHYCGSGRFEGRTADIYDTPQLRQLKEAYQDHLPSNTSREAPRLFHRLSTHVGSKDYILNVRTISLTISLFSIFWVYLAVWNWRRSWTESLLAASLLGLSWEMAYHARWFVPDSMMMQFAALMLMFLSYAHRSSHPGAWLKCAAVAVGLACGTKYTGGILLVPLMISVFYYLKTWSLLVKHRKTIVLFVSSILLGGALGYIAGIGHKDQYMVVLAGCIAGGLFSKWLSQKKLESWLRPSKTTISGTNQLEFSLSVQIRLYVGIFFLVGLAFLITTPALMLEPVKVWEFVLHQKSTYSNAGINGYGVLEQLDHLQRMIIYLSAVLFSGNTVIAIFFAVMSLIGLYCLRAEKALVMILALVIVIYILYISRYQLMYVRNLQILIPFLAILSAIGCGYGQQRVVRLFSRQAIVPAQVYRYTWPALLVVLVFVNGNWIYNAAASIDQYNKNSVDFMSRQLESLKSYIESHPDKSFVLSKKLSERWSAAGYPDYPQLGGGEKLDAGAYAVFSSAEAVSKHGMIGANRFNAYYVVSPGPYEMNFDYYPTINLAKDRIVIAPVSQMLKEIGSIFPTTMSLDRTSVTQIAHHVPGFEADALEPLIDMEFEQEAEFFKAISNRIGIDSANAYWGVIWAFTRFSLISEQ